MPVSFSLVNPVIPTNAWFISVILPAVLIVTNGSRLASIKLSEYYDEELPNVNYSDYISEKLQHDYTYLSNIFSEVKGITIQQFIIVHKVERIKELIIYDELNITEIAWKMNYSSVAHLSNQFKKVTGLSPSHFKQLKDKKRNPIDEIGN